MGWLKLFSSALDYLFPSYCLICGSQDVYQAGYLICKECIDSISFITHPFCSCCGKPFFTENSRDHLCSDCLSHKSHFNFVRALGTYEGILEKIIHQLKYKHKFAVGNIFNLLLDACQFNEIDFSAYDFFIPVPLHQRRLRQRGFNQAVIIGKVLQKKYKVPLKLMVLERTVYTLPQVGLRGKERKNNVRNAFRVKDLKVVQNKSILLLDDVFTTGATINECARVLKAAGASRVDGFVVARAV